MIRNIVGVLFLFVAVGACIDPYKIEKMPATNMLVVEGVISNQLKKHQIFLSRASALDDKRIIREEDAIVTITDQNGSIIPLTQAGPGVYETPEFSAQPGSTYSLNITTSDGREYASKQVPFRDGADIGDVYAKYVNKDIETEKGIEIFLDTEDPASQHSFYRWNYIETYEVHAPFPSNWVWTGGNSVEFRYEGIDTCYVSDTLRHIVIRNTQNLEENRIAGQSIRFIPAISSLVRYDYSILVQQFCLSEESYLYWENLRTISEDQGSLSDIQPGSLPGNMISLTDSDETVLGYFEACRVSEKRIIFSAIDFYDEGFIMPPNIRSSCYEVEPILVHESKLGETMQQYEPTMYIWEVFGMNPNATFQLMPKRCCDCRDLGPTERPSFFN